MMVTRSPIAVLATRATLTLCLLAAGQATAANAQIVSQESIADCLSEDNERRIVGCSSLIESRLLDSRSRSLAFSRRALAFSLRQEYDKALPDYEAALKLDPGASMAFNNRAWVLWRLKRFDEGMADATRAIELQPDSHQSFDTRAHLHQSRGEVSAALKDYEEAMRLGGEKIVKIYQCGLARQKLYTGPIDGLYTSDLRKAFEACTAKADCDPLPPEEECLNATS